MPEDTTVVEQQGVCMTGVHACVVATGDELIDPSCERGRRRQWIHQVGDEKAATNK